MVAFDDKFLKLAQTVGLVILLYDRYVDDLTVILPPISQGWYFCRQTKKLKFSQQHENWEQPQDQRTFNILRSMADTIDKNLKLTVDYPSGNQDGKLPVLDLCFWVDQEQP